LSYLKFKGTTLFDGYQIIDSEKILITQPNGTIEAIVDPSDAGDDIQLIDGIIAPGFINCHCHLELSHMKGLIPEHTGLVDFIWNIVTQRHFPQEEILAAIATAEQEMLNNGIVAVGDISNNDTTVAQKSLRNLHYYNFIEVSGWHPAIAQDRFDKGLAYKQSFLASVTNQAVHFTPHAPYSVSPELWSMIQPDFDNNTVSIHNQETAFEDAFLSDGAGDFTRMYEMMRIENPFFIPSGKSSLATYISRMQNAKNALLVHNTFTNEKDIHIAQQYFDAHHLFFCLCINANQYIENSVPPVKMLMDNNCNIVVGTDSLASNHSLSILDELNTIHHFFPEIPIEKLLQWTTSNGAKALQMEDKFGSFEKGKQPGVIAITDWGSKKAAVKRLV